MAAGRELAAMSTHFVFEAQEVVGINTATSLQLTSSNAQMYCSYNWKWKT